ncbi:MAG: SDR family NAD(P)-dependent oxidoreductase [Chloroflexi bacterium]|nr:SDR family NAD(P)-dependent oxidoreductase [Chloroflexota bacterium]MBV9598408.1 SDR family NAD(P)-dependent oxidoreductase [Chloroflexota bacterium]
MTGSLVRKAAIVTGAATGIGHGIARLLAAEGAHVVVNHLQQADAAQMLVADIQSLCGRAWRLTRTSANSSSSPQYSTWR